MGPHAADEGSLALMGQVMTPTQCHNLFERKQARWSRGGIQGYLAHKKQRPLYRGTSLIRDTPPVGPCSSPVPRDLWWS